MWNDLKRIEPNLHTPCYVYDIDRLRENAYSYRRITDGRRVRVLYATMANPRDIVIRTVRQVGLGAFVNSMQHLRVVLDAGVSTSDVVFAGSGHSSAVQASLAHLGVCYCADSDNQLAAYLALRPEGQIGLRVNLGSLLSTAVDPAPRLGMTESEIRDALSSCTAVSMLHTYVGTNLSTADSYISAIKAMARIARDFDQVRDIDLGGGFALPPVSGAPMEMWQKVMDEWNQCSSQVSGRIRLTIEPGRSIVRTAGSLFVTVTDVKMRGTSRFILVDSSSTWYPRRLVHGAEDHVVRASDGSMQGESWTPAFVCGASTFSNDILVNTSVPPVEVGDVLELAYAGAYCESMHLDFLGMDAPTFWTLESGRLERIKEPPNAVRQHVIARENVGIPLTSDDNQ